MRTRIVCNLNTFFYPYIFFSTVFCIAYRKIHLRKTFHFICHCPLINGTNGLVPNYGPGKPHVLTDKTCLSIIRDAKETLDSEWSRNKSTLELSNIECPALIKCRLTDCSWLLVEIVLVWVPPLRRVGGISPWPKVRAKRVELWGRWWISRIDS